MLISSLIFLCCLVAFQYYIKRIFFIREPKFTAEFLRSLSSSAFYSPVQGTIVYKRGLQKGESIYSLKQGVKIRYPRFNVAPSDGVLIGVYLTIFDKHSVYTPMECLVASADHIRTSSNIPMLDVLEYINVHFVRTFKNWYEKNVNGFLSENERMVFKLDTGVILYLIADSSVNKVSISESVEFETLDPLTKIAHIRRGSQVDIFVPSSLNYTWWICEGDKVDIGSILGERG